MCSSWPAIEHDAEILCHSCLSISRCLTHLQLRHRQDLALKRREGNGQILSKSTSSLRNVSWVTMSCQLGGM